MARRMTADELRIVRFLASLSYRRLQSAGVYARARGVIRHELRAELSRTFPPDRQRDCEDAAGMDGARRASEGRVTRIRFRTDCWFRADDAARHARHQETLYFEITELAGVEPAQPGDCWRVRWCATGDQVGPIAGYAICCPVCKQVHSWTSARNCGSKRDRGAGIIACDHSGVGSCWIWSGSAEEGTLTAQPSLHAIDEGGRAGDNAHGCGWHGRLRNGEMVG